MRDPPRIPPEYTATQRKTELMFHLTGEQSQISRSSTIIALREILILTLGKGVQKTLIKNRPFSQAHQHKLAAKNILTKLTKYETVSPLF